MTDTAAELEARISEIIKQLQKIQKAIHSTGQPASTLELAMLRELGEEYGKLVEKISAKY